MKTSPTADYGTVIGTLKFDASGSGHRYWLEVPYEDGPLVIWLWAAVSDAPSPAEVTLAFRHGRVFEAPPKEAA